LGCSQPCGYEARRTLVAKRSDCSYQTGKREELRDCYLYALSKDGLSGVK